MKKFLLASMMMGGMWAIYAPGFPEDSFSSPISRSSHPDAVSLSCLRNLDYTLTPSQLAGKYIWFCATAGNARFFTYTYPQRLGILIDWYRVFNTDDRDDRFENWGLINDPDCCQPGDPDCPARHLTYDDTYGFDWCPGDEALLPFVGKPLTTEEAAYRDPGCDLQDIPGDSSGELFPTQDHRQSSCDLAFGTSTGALGFRKFPNPRFDREAWVTVNGEAGTWKGYQERLNDASIEPPFLIGMACGACHIAFDPLHPPTNPAHPEWVNISGTIGNQYGRMSQIFTSGMPKNSLEQQVFAYARPGVVDTSAIPTDSINNPGTMSAIINLPTRPRFLETVTKWRKVSQCSKDSLPDTCWCEFQDKCWMRGTQQELVLHILKSGEDSIGLEEALQRVYINIGSCGEEAWVNHLTDPFQLGPHERNFGQTPFQIGQARRDCPHFRAIEDRRSDLANFLLTARPTDLYMARGLAGPEELEEQLDQEFGKDAVKKGRDLFRTHCMSCHSSQMIPAELIQDFRQPSHNVLHQGIRLDWLGKDTLIPASEVGTHWSRALHTNHMTGHIWEEFNADSLRQQQPPHGLPDPVDGGRGYYRNISLLSVWAHAPFLHNNAIGPELCGQRGKDSTGEWKDPLYRSPYVTLSSQSNQDPTPVSHPQDCWRFDPSVEGRYQLFKASMESLLNPEKRIPKVTLLDEAIPLPILPKLNIHPLTRLPMAFTLSFPKGFPAAKLGNFNYKLFIQDLTEFLRNADSPIIQDIAAEFQTMKQALSEKTALSQNPHQITIQTIRNIFKGKLRRYLSSSALIENEGHPFGETLSSEEKDSLTAFLATL